MTSRIAGFPVVRDRLVDLQRAFGAAHGAVLEGRDIGTVVFPDTPHKFFLDARPEVRVRRRREQLRAAGAEPAGEKVAAEIDERDRRDSQRAVAPLTYDASYQRIDTSELSVDEVVAMMAGLVRG